MAFSQQNRFFSFDHDRSTSGRCLLMLNWRIEHARPALLRAPALEDAISHVKKKINVEMEIGKRLEVCWDVKADDDENEAGGPAESTATEAPKTESERKWWGCTLTELVGLDDEDGPVWKIVYDAEEDGLEEEQRHIIFCGKMKPWKLFGLSLYRSLFLNQSYSL